MARGSPPPPLLLCSDTTDHSRQRETGRRTHTTTTHPDRPAQRCCTQNDDLVPSITQDDVPRQRQHGRRRTPRRRWLASSARPCSNCPRQTSIRIERRRARCGYIRCRTVSGAGVDTDHRSSLQPAVLVGLPKLGGLVGCWDADVTCAARGSNTGHQWRGRSGGRLRSQEEHASRARRTARRRPRADAPLGWAGDVSQHAAAAPARTPAWTRTLPRALIQHAPCPRCP